MVISSVLEVSRQVRRAKSAELDVQQGTGAAIQWRAARLEHLPWAQGEQGSFPEPDQLTWQLEDPTSVMPAVHDGLMPDGRWRTLAIYRQTIPMADRPVLTVPLRLTDPPPATQPADQTDAAPVEESP